MRLRWSFVFFLLLVSFMFTVSAMAQTTVASLNGFITDTSGAVLTGSRVTLINRSTSAVRSTTSGKDGTFQFLALNPGSYRLRVSHASFEVTEVQNLTLNVNDQRQIFVRLKPGSVHEIITVTAAAALSTDTSVSTTIDRQFVENMPLNGRTFQNLIELAPGVVPSVGGPGQFTVNGLRSTENYFTVDGVSANVGMSVNISGTADNGYGAYAGGAIPGFNQWGGTNSLLSVDALEEFKVDTATSQAQFGRGMGGQVQIRSRSGSNQFHGSLSEYMRNQILDANDWFYNHYITGAGVWAPIPRKALRMNNFGGTFGGPILRNKLFFFGDYEGMRLHQPTLVSSYSIVSRVRNQLTGNMLQLANALPLPSGTELSRYMLDPTDNTYKLMLSGAASYSATSINISNMNSYAGRIDWNPASHWNFFVRLSDAPTNGGTQLASFQSLNTSNIKFVTGGFTFTHGSNFSNDFRLNLTENTARGYGTMVAVDGSTPVDYSSVVPAGYNIYNSSANFTLSSAGFGLGSTSNNLMRQINLTDTVYWNLKRHTLGLGDDFRYIFPRFSPSNFTVAYNFGTPANLTGFTTTQPYTTYSGVFVPAGTTFPAGTLTSATYTAGTWVTTIQKGNAAYITDNYRATDRLTFNLGMRWEVNPAPYGTAKKPLYTLQGWTIGSNDFSNLSLAPGGSSMYATRWYGFSPRIGVAYVVHSAPGSATVVRAAYSRNLSVGSIGSTASAALFPYYRSGQITGPGAYLTYPVSSNLLQPAPINSLAGPYTYQSFNLFDPNYRIPYSHEETVSLQQQIGTSTSMMLAYVGTNGRALMRRFIYQVPYTGANVNFAGDNIYVSSNPSNNSDSSDYNALQATLQRSLSHGLQFLVNYTWSHAIDTGSQDVPANFTSLSTTNPVQLNTFAPAAQRGSSDSDRRHRITGAATYITPRANFGEGLLAHAASVFLADWGVAPTVTAQTGAPINIYYLRYLNSTQSVSLRPDAAGGQSMWLEDSTQIGGKRLNAAAYSIPTDVRQGSAQRNAAIGFGHYTFDAAFYRDAHITDKVKLRARADVFNVFNHPNFPDPSGYLGYLSWNYTSNVQGAFQSNASFGTLGSASKYTAGSGLASAQAADSGLSTLFQSSSPRSIQISLKLTF